MPRRSSSGICWNFGAGRRTFEKKQTERKPVRFAAFITGLWAAQSESWCTLTSSYQTDGKELIVF